jgi:hypothetical protein
MCGRASSSFRLMLDVDGVLNQHWVYLCSELRNQDGPVGKPIYPWHVYKYDPPWPTLDPGVEVTFVDCLKLWRSPDFWQDMPPDPEAVKALKMLRVAHGDQLDFCYVTQRDSLVTTAGDVQTWLDLAGFPRGRVEVLRRLDDRMFLIRQLRPEAYVDDCLENLEAMVGIGEWSISRFLLEKPYNRSSMMVDDDENRRRTEWTPFNWRELYFILYFILDERLKRAQ